MSNTDGQNRIVGKNVVVETEKNVFLSRWQKNSRYWYECRGKKNRKGRIRDFMR